MLTCSYLAHFVFNTTRYARLRAPADAVISPGTNNAYSSRVQQQHTDRLGWWVNVWVTEPQFIGSYLWGLAHFNFSRSLILTQQSPHFQRLCLPSLLATHSPPVRKGLRWAHWVQNRSPVAASAAAVCLILRSVMSCFLLLRYN
jgi:hypothetical protein